MSGHPSRHHRWPCAVALLATALASCSGDTNLVRDAAVATGGGAERRQAPDFVAASRPATSDYQPVGVAPAPRAITAKPRAGVQAVEAQMDAVRAANEARAAAARQAGAALATPPAPAPRP